MSNKQLVFGREARKLLKEGVDTVANAVKATLGSNGKNVIIAKDFNLPHVTKDGYSVAKDIQLSCPFKNIGVELIKEVSHHQVKEVGDGTTTTTVIAQALLENAFDEIDNSFRQPKQVKEELEKAVLHIVDKIKENSKPCTEIKELFEVAKISANGDEVIAKIVSEAVDSVGKSGIIIFEEGDKDEVKLSNGINLNRTGVNSHLSSNLENPAVLVSLEALSMEDILPVMEKYIQINQPILIVAPSFVNDTLQVLTMNVMQRGFKISVINNPGFGKNIKTESEDLAAALGCKPYTKITGNNILDSIGHCEKVEITDDETKIIEPKGDITEYIANLKDNNRIAVLENKVATICIGAKSDIEYRERYDRYEDAICSAKAALEEGIVAGGGQTLKSISTGYAWIDKSIHEPSNLIGEINGAPIDPAKVTRCAVENAASVIGTIIMTECLIADEKEEKKDKGE